MKERSAIILLGGGMTSAYGAGFLSELFKANIFPDVVIATSGNAGNAAHYVSKDSNALKYATKCWLDYLTRKEFIDFNKKQKKVNIDYLVDEIFKVKAPINIEAVKNSQIKLYIPATNLMTTEVNFFTNKDEIDFFELLRATKSVPYYYNKFVKIENNLYADLAPFTNFNDYLNVCKREKVKNLLVINNQTDSLIGNLLFLVYSALFINFKFINKVMNILFDSKEVTLKNSDFNFIYFKDSQIQTFDNSLASVKNSFSKGQADALANLHKIQSLV